MKPIWYSAKITYIRGTLDSYKVKRIFIIKVYKKFKEVIDMAFNMDNHFEVEGRLARNPVFFDNADGSRKVKFTVVVGRNYKNKDGEEEADFIPVERFISKDKVAASGNGLYANMDKGMLVRVGGHLESNQYTDKSGKTVYGLTPVIDTVRLKESKTASEARRAHAAAPLDAVAEAETAM